MIMLLDVIDKCTGTNLMKKNFKKYKEMRLFADGILAACCLLNVTADLYSYANGCEDTLIVINNSHENELV